MTGVTPPLKNIMKKASKKSEKAATADGGISAKQKQQLRSAIRQVWSWSKARKICIARATGPDGFGVCEKCMETVAKLYADHIIPCGDLDGGYFDRTFVPSTELQAICKRCHDRKTRLERKALESKVT